MASWNFARRLVERTMVTGLIVGLIVPPLSAVHPDQSVANGTDPDRYLGERRAETRGASLFWLSGGQAASSDARNRVQNAKTSDGLIAQSQGVESDQIGQQVTPATERTIGSGLSWLAGRQNADGSFGSGVYRRSIAVTSLAGLALMASGSSPGRGPYGRTIEKALHFILQDMSPAGLIAVPEADTQGPMYSHGFGTLFLAEAYGMTHQPEIREKLVKAVRLIVDTQNIEGGWRYQPVRRDADLSVTICQINALRAARNAGLFVPKQTVDACIRYVKGSQNADGGFRYMLPGGASAFPRSAAGVVALYSAAVYDAKEIERGIDYLKQHRPEVSLSRGYGHYFYAHYYAAQAMWIRGGNDWLAWYASIRDELMSSQLAHGAWQDRVCDEYGTAMALLVLQMPNNLLPIFQR